MSGKAILYADNLTDSMAKAIEETERRRFSWNITRSTEYAPADYQNPVTQFYLSWKSRRLNSQQLDTVLNRWMICRSKFLLITQLEGQMKESAKNLEFEEAVPIMIWQQTNCSVIDHN